MPESALKIHLIELDSIVHLLDPSTAHFSVNSHSISSDNTLLLSATAIHIFSSLSNEISQSIGESKSFLVPRDLRQRALQFMSCVQFLELTWMRGQEQAELALQYLDSLSSIYQGLKKPSFLEIRMKGDDSSGLHYCCFQGNELLHELLSQFHIECYSLMAIQDFPLKLELLEKGGRFFSVFENKEVGYSIRDNNLTIYGPRAQVVKYKQLLISELESVKRSEMPPKFAPSPSYYFTIFRKLSMHYGKTRMQGKTLYHFPEISPLLHFDSQAWDAMSKQDYDLACKNDKILSKVCEERVKMSAQGEKIFGPAEVISKLRELSIKNRLADAEKEKEKQVYALVKNVEVSEQNFKEFLSQCSSFKVSESVFFKIDIDRGIRIMNRSKSNRRVHIVFSSFPEFIHLLALIEDEFDFKQIAAALDSIRKQFFRTHTELLSINKQTTLVLYPANQMLLGTDLNEHDQISGLIALMNKQTNFKVLVCGVQFLQKILGYQKIDGYKICIPQDFPQLPFLIDRKPADTKNPFKCEIDKDSKITDYEEIAWVSKVLAMRQKDYSIQSNDLTSLDQFNIARMLADHIPRVFIALRQQTVKAQFVYLVYLDKFMEVQRAADGSFQALRPVDKQKVLTTIDMRRLAPFFLNAFFIGQKYLSLRIPIKKLVEVKIQQVKDYRPKPENHYILQYYKRKLEDSCSFKVRLEPKCSVEYFKLKYAGHYTLRFNSSQVKKMILETDFGYGEVTKAREGKWLKLTMTPTLCRKLLQKFILSREHETKSR